MGECEESEELSTPVREVPCPCALTPKPARNAKSVARLENELSEATRNGALGEVVALLRLCCPDLPVVFSAVSIGCPATLQAVLDHQEDPDEKSEGLSPLSMCVMISTATPMQPHRGMARRPNFTLDTGIELLRALLSAGATPTTEDLWRACHINNAALGGLLLGAANGAQLVAAGRQRSLLRVAGMHCPDLVYPLLDRGASLAEFGPDGVLPKMINPSVFREARWKLLRTLCLLHGRGFLPIPNHLLRLIGHFIAEPFAPRLTLPDPRNEPARGLGLNSSAFSPDLYSVCSPQLTPMLLPPMLGFCLPPPPLFSA
jgi:hypothetical protein